MQAQRERERKDGVACHAAACAQLHSLDEGSRQCGREVVHVHDEAQDDPCQRAEQRQQRRQRRHERDRQRDEAEDEDDARERDVREVGELAAECEGREVMREEGAGEGPRARGAPDDPADLRERRRRADAGDRLEGLTGHEDDHAERGREGELEAEAQQRLRVGEEDQRSGEAEGRVDVVVARAHRSDQDEGEHRDRAADRGLHPDDGDQQQHRHGRQRRLPRPHAPEAATCEPDDRDREHRDLCAGDHEQVDGPRTPELLHDLLR